MDIKEIRKLRAKYDQNLYIYQKMERYYNGETDIQSTYKNSKIGLNRKVNVNFVKKFIEEEKSYAIGNPITYSPNLTVEEIMQGKTIQDSVIESNLVNAIMKENNHADSLLATNLLKFGVAYEHFYFKDNEFKIKEYSPLSTIANVDEENNVINALRVFHDNDNNEFMDYFDKDEVIRMDSNFNVIETTPHYFGFCPIAYGNLIGTYKNTIYQDIKSLQDQVENLLSDLCNEVGDSRLSYLILKNMTVPEEIKEKFTNKETGEVNFDGIMNNILTNLRDNAILNISTSDSKNDEGLSYLTKNVNSEMHISALTQLIDLIYQISQHINLNQNPANTSGIQIQTRIISLRNKIKMLQNVLTKVIKKRIEAIITIISKQYGKEGLDYKKVTPIFGINIPADNSVIADIACKLIPLGILDAESALSQLSFVSNAKEIYAKAQKEYVERIKTEDEARELNVGELDG